MPASVERLDWSPDVLYVIGHQRPDTDAIAAALGYAWLLHETGTENVRAVRCGQPSEQARYALERFEQSAPGYVAAVAPTFAHIVERTPAVRAGAPLIEALARLGEGAPVVPVVGERGAPLGVVTPLGLARAFAHTQLGGGGDHGAMPSCGGIAEPAPLYRSRDRLSDYRNAVLRAEANQFLVVDETGAYVGLASQRRLLQPPRARLILVDHNELPQAVPGADEAEIVGVLDHHRLGNPPTAAPIPFQVEPVGSTSTLVAEQARARRIAPPRGIAGILLSGILSDTLVFRSPTTHARDEAMAEWLGGVCRIDPWLYGKELLNAAPGLAARTVDDILDSDRKTYVMAQVLVSIGQVEVSRMQELPDRREELLDALAVRRVREGHAMICLMVTDIVTGTSRLLCSGERPFLDALPFSHVGEAEFDLGDIVSRKKQLAPAIQNALESVV